MTTAKKSVAFRISSQADAHLNRIASITGMSKTAAVEMAIVKLSQSFMGEKMEHNEVANMNGKLINFDAAVNLMDDDIREALADQQKWDSYQAFFSAYEQAHLEQFGEAWELSKSNPVW
jgi:predicted transcriptional regulator